LNEHPTATTAKKGDKRVEVVRRNVDIINLPKVDTPRPIRTPSQVMRIWVAPWEDKDNDLVWSQFIDTEVEKRKWNYGNQLHAKEQTLHPLEVKAREASQARATQPEDSNSKKGARK
jgi:conjugal transfer pilus assembly protein TraV